MRRRVGSERALYMSFTRVIYRGGRSLLLLTAFVYCFNCCPSNVYLRGSLFSYFAKYKINCQAACLAAQTKRQEGIFSFALGRSLSLVGAQVRLALVGFERC